MRGVVILRLVRCQGQVIRIIKLIAVDQHLMVVLQSVGGLRQVGDWTFGRRHQPDRRRPPRIDVRLDLRPFLGHSQPGEAPLRHDMAERPYVEAGIVTRRVYPLQRLPDIAETAGQEGVVLALRQILEQIRTACRSRRVHRRHERRVMQEQVQRRECQPVANAIVGIATVDRSEKRERDCRKVATGLEVIIVEVEPVRFWVKIVNSVCNAHCNLLFFRRMFSQRKKIDTGIPLMNSLSDILRMDGQFGHHEAVTLPYALQRILEKIARLRRAQILGPVIATEGEEVKAPRVFVSDESARHRWKAYNESLQMSRKSRTGLPRFVLSQVPKCEAPGAPIFSGCIHFSRHLGHPPSSC